MLFSLQSLTIFCVFPHHFKIFDNYSLPLKFLHSLFSILHLFQNLQLFHIDQLPILHVLLSTSCAGSISSTIIVRLSANSRLPMVVSGFSLTSSVQLKPQLFLSTLVCFAQNVLQYNNIYVWCQNFILQHIYLDFEILSVIVR